MKSKNEKICESVRQIYHRLDEQIKLLDADCSACGKCCDFDSFGHKLYVTSPELLYFSEKLSPLRKMPTGRCPYQEQNRCTAREFRFAGCRIFFCKGNAEKQNAVCEETIKKFKTLCDEYDFPYQYMELSAAMNNIDQILK